jgi:hypothetical protein
LARRVLLRAHAERVLFKRRAPPGPADASVTPWCPRHLRPRDKPRNEPASALVRRSGSRCPEVPTGRVGVRWSRARSSLRGEGVLPAREAPFMPPGEMRQLPDEQRFSWRYRDPRVGPTRDRRDQAVSGGHAGLQRISPTPPLESARRRRLSSSSWLHPSYRPRSASGDKAEQVGRITWNPNARLRC